MDLRMNINDENGALLERIVICQDGTDCDEAIEAAKRIIGLVARGFNITMLIEMTMKQRKVGK